MNAPFRCTLEIARTTWRPILQIFVGTIGVEDAGIALAAAGFLTVSGVHSRRL
jgi:hypothetical protein